MTDRKILVVIGIIGFAVAMAGFGVARTAGHFMMFAIALGVSMGLAFTSVGALIAETVDPESRGLAMGGYNTCIYFGMMLNSVLMGTLIQTIGFKYAFYLTAVVNLFFIAIFYLLMQDFSPIRNEPVR